MKLKILTGLILCLSFFCKAQQIQFANVYFNSGYFRLNNFIELPDSGFLLNTSYGPTSATFTNFLFRINKFGDTTETHTYSPYWIYSPYFSDICMVNDSEMYASASLFNQYYGINIVKINYQTWDTSLHHSYGISGQGAAGGLFKTYGGYLMCNGSAGSYNVIKLDSNLNLQWYTSTPYESLGNLLIDSMNNILVTCYVPGFALHPYAYSYFDSTGALIWARAYGNNTAQDPDTYVTGTVITSDSNFLAFTPGGDWQLMKINRVNGDTLWTKQFPYPIQYGFSFKSNWHYVFTTWAGVTTKWQIDDEGNVLASNPLPIYIVPTKAHNTMDGGFALCGTSGTGPPQNIVLPAFIKFDSLGNTVSTSIISPNNNFAPLSFYPNPARDEIFINAGSMATEKNVVFTLSDMQGRMVLQQVYENNTAIDISVIPAGLYIATLRGKEKELRGKVMVEK